MDQNKIDNSVNSATQEIIIPLRVKKHIKGTTYKVITSFNGNTNKDLKSAILHMICRDLDAPVSPAK